MTEKYFPKKNTDSHFYLPGEEIRINPKSSFSHGYSNNDPLETCKNRVSFVISSFALVFTIICLRLFNVCVSNNYISSHTAKVESLKAYAINPIKRADILDRNGTIIATSLPTVNLYANPKKIYNHKSTALKLSKILTNLEYDTIYKKLSSKSSFIYIKRNLTPSQQYQINYLGIPGLEFENGEKRVYPHKNLFAHIIGKTNIDNLGVSGLEKSLDERLTESNIPLRLSIDAGIQDTIRTNLLEAIEKYKALGATAILMNVKTSEVISMISLPDYDPNLSTNKNSKTLFNIATSGVYETGSVFKVFNATMSLDSGKIKVTDSFDASKPLKLKYNTIKDYRGENRVLTVPEILIHSSNIGSAKMALEVGGNEQRKFMEKLGFFNKLKFELSELGSPIVPKRWGEGTIATVSYGYGLAVSPLHVATAFAAIVNDGMYKDPTLIRHNSKNIAHKIVSKKTSRQMIKLLRDVVISGSGKRANVKGYEIAGKTGTANKLSKEGKYVNKKVRTTFMATFPSSKPQYIILVMLDEPKATTESWGFVTSGWNTVPVAGKIISEIAPQLDIKANFDLDEERNARIIEAVYSKN